MIFIKTLFVVVEVLCCLLLIGLVLLQKSKSEGLGLAFGAGAGESLFGARAGNVLSKITVVIGVVFMASTLVLGILFSQQDSTLMDSAAPLMPQGQAMQAPLELDTTAVDVAPVVEVPAAQSEDM
ncbi:preprotein translocase subunit SecG [Pontiella sulfatireligans]|uniref:Protein-export membrane protein SecG n=1 Tax=Pontiella sulfatireligans TaxID=2750658 RepID=A0A6C2US32_9BACT|nr:preprotein translocase subunit SecG [Pontiella sulfatireligans]VGO22939.1 Protein-export membrane protein SecG [Pontiella sulfatireligans]